MALDPYTPCPCGSGKKLKFCECAAESAELEKILIAIDGDQRVAALDQINRVLAQKPQQKAMLALKGIVQLQLADEAGGKETVKNFLAIAPNNPVALSLSSILSSTQENKEEEAVVYLQKALAASQQDVHYLVPEAMLGVAQALISQGKVLAARAHLLLRIALQGQDAEDRPAMQLLMRLNSSPELPLASKQDLAPREPKATTPGKSTFEEALDAASNGNWLSAAEKFESLHKQHAADPEILFNLAVFRTYLGNSQAAALWRRYAHLANLPLEDAVEAEVLAQELDSPGEGEQIDQLRVVYAVKDASRLLEILVGDKRVARMPVDLSRLVPEGTPPPRGAYWLLDREVPDSGANITLESVPRVLGEVLLFGKETDREARVEFLISKTPDMVAKVRQLQAVGAAQLGMIEKEEKVGTTHGLDEALVARWRLPEDTPEDVKRKLVEEQYSKNMLEVLPKQKIKALDGRTPREVASDPAYRIRLLGLIRTYEIEYHQKRQKADFNELRRSLGLPPQETLDPTGVDIYSVSLLRLDRYDFSKLTEQQLLAVLERASVVQHIEALRLAAEAALQRDDLKGKFEKCDAYQILSSVSADLNEALELIHKAQQAATEVGRSPARYLLSEFDLRLARREPDEVSRLMQTLQSRHMKEPGIAEALYMKLMQLGLINPDGTPRGMPAAAPRPGAVPAPAGGSNFWTPDGPSSPAPAGSTGEKSKLWLPGME